MASDNNGMSHDEWSALHECLLHWRCYLVTSVTAIVLALVICAGIPDTYSAQVKVSDEHFESDLLLGLNNMAAWAKGAINEHKGLRMPEVYYRIVESPSFVDEMSHVSIPGKDTDYYHYLLSSYRYSVWRRLFAGRSIARLTEQERIHAIISDNIRSKVSSKYGTVLMQVTDQDPVVAAMLADSVCSHLQSRLLEYSRQRYLRDLDEAAKDLEVSRQRFESARDEYVRYRDTHNDITTPSAESMEDHLANEYDYAFSDYSSRNEQYLRAKAFVEKYSLKFAVIKNATVPDSPSGPSRAGYLLALLFVAFVGSTWWSLGLRTYKEYKNKRLWS